MKITSVFQDHCVGRLRIATRLVWLWILLGASVPASAVVITNTAVKDNTLYEVKSGDPYTSNGEGSGIFVGRTRAKGGEPGFNRRTVIAFTNLHQVIPASATINSAILRLYLTRSRLAGTETLTVHRLLGDWGEGTSNANGEEGKGANAAPGDATWHHQFFDTNTWIADGGDYVVSPSASTNVQDILQYYYWSSAQLTADVQEWVTNSASNVGWILIGNESVAGTAKRFASRQYPTSAEWPALIVDYTVAEPIGACDLPGGGCSQTTSNLCASLGGTWNGPGTVCPAATGACCLPDGSCTNTTATNCIALGGVYQGDDVPCTSNLCPIVLEPFVDPLPIPPVATPVSGTVGGVATYDMNMQQFTNKLHRDLPPTILWGYNSVFPGPTIIASNGAPITVNYTNDLRDANGNLRTNHHLPVDLCLHGPNMLGDTPRTVVHLHGGHVPPEVDGYPEATFLPGDGVSYVYPNNQAASLLWYHDHAVGITRLNVYMGLAGAYVVRDAAEAALGLPSGEFEVPLIIQDRRFNSDGSLYYPAAWQQHFFGDKMLVNGKVWPYEVVKQGKYRFRVLNGCNARTLTLGLDNGLDFQVLGSEGGFLSAPVTTNLLHLGPAERADVIVDFQSQSNGAQIILTNGASAPYPGPAGVGVITNVMRFVVTNGPAFTDPVPGSLVPVVALSTNDAVVERTLVLDKVVDECTGERWVINGLGWDDEITEMPILDTTEIWSFVNRSGFSHPMHMHLVFFQVLDRQPFQVISNTIVPTGPRVPPPPEEAGWKDTVQVEPQEITRVIARFDDYPGLFPYHCHILEHEDNDMMRQFWVLEPPSITQQPTNLTVAVDAPASFSLMATGTPPLSVQWYFTNSLLAGETNDTLSIPSAEPGDAGDYFAIVTNLAGSITSSVATLTVFEYPAILTGPLSQTVPVGSNVTFDVLASGTEPLAYQWRYGGSALPGEIATNLNLANVQLTNAGDYDVVVTNNFGSVTSSVATLTVFEYPMIVTAPMSKTVPVGSNATFYVVASGTDPLAYQWRFNTADLLGETDTNLSLLGVQWADLGTYDVVVTNLYGAVTSAPASLGIVYLDAELLYAGTNDWLTLQWLGTNWQLQQSLALSNWTAYPAVPVLNGPTNTLNVLMTNDGEYFRLKRD